MSGNFPTGGDRKGKRMLPSVSDVVRELQGITGADQGLLFKAARQVCADELARVKQGFEAAPVEVLVDRARILLDPSLATTPSTDLGTLFEPAPPAPRQPGAAHGPDEPFGETSGALDLKWDAAATEAGPATEILSLPEPSPGLPGDETLAGLEREAHALSLTRAGTEWRGADVPLGTHPAPPPPEEPPSAAAPYEESRPMFTPPRSSRSPVLYVVLGIALVAAGFGAWKWASRRVLDIGKPTVVPAPGLARRKRPDRTPGPAAIAVAPQTTAATASTAATSAAASAPATRPAAEGRVAPVVPAPTATPLAIAVARPTKPPAPAPTAALRETPAPAPTYRLGGGPVPTRPPSKVPAAPVAASAAPAPARAVAPAPAPVAPRAAVAAKGPKVTPRAQPMPSPDWAGKPGVYVIHFTSYKDRKPAALDAARLAEKFGHPGHAIAVDLGAKGTWYRAVLGDFATVEEAKAFREKLAAEKTPSLGLVYYLTE